MKSTTFKRAAALLLALVMCLTAFPGFGITAHAATDVTDEIFMIAFPREGDSAYDDDWGHSALTFKNGWHTARSRYTNIRAIGSYSSQICYCIEPGVPQNTGDEFSQKGENFWDNYPSDYNDVLSPDEIKLFIGRIFQYGYTGNISLNWRSQNSADADKLSHAIATQLLIWETVVGERDSDFNKVDSGSYDAVLGYLNEKHPLRDQVMSHYNSMVSSVKKHTKLPSFMTKSTGNAQTVELAWNGSEYTAVLTDSNEVLSGYTFSSDDSKLKFSVSGDKLTITSPTAPAEKVSITAEKTKSQRKGVVVWTDGVYGPEGELQDVVTFAETVSDPVKGYLNVKVSVGSLKIIKESEDGRVDGIRFRVVGNGIDETVTTGKDGQIQIDNLTPGTYEVSELSEDIYEPQKTRTVTVAVGQTASVTFSNTLKRGNLKVIKTAEDDFIEGIRFHLTGTSAAGIAVDEYAVTDATGTAFFENLPIGSGYKLEEVDTKAYYVVPDAQTSVIEWNTVTEYRFHNELKRGNLKVSKSAEDNFVEGIRFRLTGTSDSGIPVDEYAVTDASGIAAFENILIGSGYTLEEVETAARYVIPDSQTTDIRWNEVTEASFENKLVRGSILGKKVDEFGNTISGALFGLFREDVTDFTEENAAMTVLSDDSGIFSFQNVPYGSWIVRELQPAPGFVLNENSYPVTVGEDEAVIEIVIENRFIFGSVQTTKVDAAYPDHKLSGAVFEIYVDANCDQVYTTEIDVLIGEMTETEPGVYRMDNLRYCGYFLYEKTAPDGFLKDDNYHYFEISQDGEFVTVENEAGVGFLNKPITGSVQTTKVDADYPENKLTGAVFEVYTDADGDQVYNAEVDTLIGEMTEVETGIYRMDDLRYGGYFLFEKSAPEVFLKDDNYHYFQIRQNGEVVTVENEAGVGFLNKPITGSVQTTKVDAEYPDHKLTGAVFEIYLDTDNDGIFNADADTLHGEMTETEPGIYRLDNLRCGSYFLHEKTAPYGFLRDEGYHLFQINTHGEVVTVENEAGVGFINQPGTGGLWLTKKDVSDGKLLPGVGFRIRNEDGEIVAEGYTDDNGEAKFTLRVGKYTYQEFSALEGYELDDAEYPFEIKENGEIVKAVMTNEKSWIPQTGDESHLGLWIALATAAMLGLIATGSVCRKKGGKRAC